MDSIILTNKELNTYENIGKQNGMESTIYINGDTCYKILKEKYRIKREPIIEELHELKIPNTIIPDKKIVMNDSFVGYTMKYKKTYKRLFYLYNLDLESKIKLCIRLIDTYKIFLDNQIIYEDIHNKNIIVRKNSICYIDMDSIQKLNSLREDQQMSRSEEAIYYFDRFIIDFLTRIDIEVLRREGPRVIFEELFNTLFKNITSLQEFRYRFCNMNYMKELVSSIQDSQLRENKVRLKKLMADKKLIYYC